MVVDDSNKHELCRYKLTSSITSRGLVFSSLRKKHGNWTFNALGLECEGSSATTVETKKSAIDRTKTLNMSEFKNKI